MRDAEDTERCLQICFRNHVLPYLAAADVMVAAAPGDALADSLLREAAAAADVADHGDSDGGCDVSGNQFERILFVVHNFLMTNT